MQDETISAEIDPWDAWQTSSLDPSSIDETPSEPVIEAGEFVFGLPSAEELEAMLARLERAPGTGLGSSETQRCPVPLVEPQMTSPFPATQSCGETSLSAIDPELREAFLDDANVCMGAVETAAILLEADANNRQAVLEISRQLHTLKGASASVGLKQLADRLHDLEEKLRQDQLEGKAPASDFLLDSLDWFRFQLSEIRNQKSKPLSSAEPSELPLGLQEFLHSSEDSKNLPRSSDCPSGAVAIEPLVIEAADDDDSVRVKTSQLNRLMDLLSGLVMLRNRRQTETNDLREIYHELGGVVTKLKLLSSLSAKARSVAGSSDTDAGWKNHPQPFSACFGEGSIQLSEIAADVQEMAQRVRECTRPVAEGNEAVSQFIRQFRQELVELCRAPINGLFHRLQRSVRDAARAESKSVRIECVGINTTVERSLQQRLYEPLLHIVRNSVCHGVETAQQRQEAGKQPTGVITLEVSSSADLLVMEVRDDGGGLNYSAIRQRAIERGLLESDYLPTEQELAQLIFHPGFSTRQTANQQAGRGVGMDIVATTLARLGGWIDVDSVSGQGTSVRLSVPLRSAIEHLMVFRCGQQYFALPLLSVQSAGQPERQSPCVSLSSLLVSSCVEDCREQASLLIDLESPVGRRLSSQRKRLNLLVDEIVGPEEVVVRPLPMLIRSHPYCSGATLGTSGQTVLVLDARRLFAHFSQQKVQFTSSLDTDDKAIANQQKSIQHSSLAVSGLTDEATAQPLILVVDDSVSSRKLVVRALSRFPVRVLEASDGRQALQLLKSHKFAAIFSDLEMPHVDGLQLLADVRSRESLRDIPFTMITSRQEEEFSSKAAQLGVTRYLNKPVKETELDTILSEIPSLRPFVSSPSQVH